MYNNYFKSITSIISSLYGSTASPIIKDSVLHRIEQFTMSKVSGAVITTAAAEVAHL